MSACMKIAWREPIFPAKFQESKRSIESKIKYRGRLMVDQNFKFTSRILHKIKRHNHGLAPLLKFIVIFVFVADGLFLTNIVHVP